MIRELDVGGIYVVPWMGSAAIALCLLFGLRMLLTRWGAYRWVWHAAFFDVALFVVLMALVSLGTAFVEA